MRWHDRGHASAHGATEPAKAAVSGLGRCMLYPLARTMKIGVLFSSLRRQNVGCRVLLC
jgi:hypothetical protein